MDFNFRQNKKCEKFRARFIAEFSRIGAKCEKQRTGEVDADPLSWDTRALWFPSLEQNENTPVVRVVNNVYQSKVRDPNLIRASSSLCLAKHKAHRNLRGGILRLL